MNTIARKDFVRVFHPTAEQEYRNTPVSFRRETHAGLIITALCVGALIGACVALAVLS